MSETGEDPEEFRAKFVDIRIKPPGGRKNGRGKVVPETRKCEHKGCDAIGDCKAPKQTAESLKRKRKTDDDFHWFCQRHAAEYNKRYNFFDGMTDAEFAAFQASENHGHKKTWRFGTGPVGGKKAAYANDPRRWKGKPFLGEDGELGEGPTAAPPSGGQNSPSDKSSC